MNEPCDDSTICGHEAAHAVMRYLLGLPAGHLTVNERGGNCAGTGKGVRPDDLILVILAGIAYEGGFFPDSVDLQGSKFQDLDDAREIISRGEMLRYHINAKQEIERQDVETTLARWFRECCERLIEYAVEIEELGSRLQQAREMSRRSVAQWMRWNIGR